jgi:hypothetical protein
MKYWQCLGFVNRLCEINKFVGLSLSRVFFIVIFFPGSVYAMDHTYIFDQKQLCEQIESASTWRDLVPLIQDQVRLHFYCAARTKVSVNDYEYFQRDWDEPRSAAGRPKGMHARLIDWINNLAPKDVSSLVYYMDNGDDRTMHQKKICESFYIDALLAREKTLRGEGSIERGIFDSLYKSALYFKKIERKKRRKKLEQFCREWLMAHGKLPVRGEKKSIGAVKLTKIPSPDLYKEELLEVAHDLRWKYEWSTKGMDSFVRYIACSQKGFADEGQAAAFCRTTAVLINGHLDMYGALSSLTIENNIENNQDKFFITAIKDIMKDSVHRFHVLLTQSFSQDSQGSPVLKEQPYLGSLNEKQLRLRKIFAASMQEVIEEEEASVNSLSSRRGRVQVTKPHPPRPPDWCPPTEAQKAEEAAKIAAEKWDRLQLIDEVKLVLPLKTRSKTVWPYRPAVVDSDLLERRTKAGLLPYPKGLLNSVELKNRDKLLQSVRAITAH